MDITDIIFGMTDKTCLQGLGRNGFTRLEDIRNTEPLTAREPVPPQTGNNPNLYSGSKESQLTQAISPFANNPNKQALVKKLLEVAYSYKGTPYYMGEHGVNDTSSFDCSSFTRFCYKQIGINIPRDTLGQVKVGTPVDRSALQPGDLVFWERTYRAGVSHVGLFVSGTKFIAAGSSKGVNIGDLTNSYYASRWHAARRLL